MNDCKCYIEHGNGDIEEIIKCPLCTAAPDLLDACRHVRDNLAQESEEVWEIEIACLDYAIAKAKP